jgi:hypothetical protein
MPPPTPVERGGDATLPTHREKKEPEKKRGVYQSTPTTPPFEYFFFSFFLKKNVSGGVI